MKKIFLSTEYRDDKTALSKARADVMAILESEAYHTVYFPKISSVGVLVRFWKQLSSIVSKDSHIVLEYPCRPRKRITIIYLFCLLKGIKLFGIIHDIGDLRFPEAKQVSDMKFLRRFNVLIAHNSAMTKWLRAKGYRSEIIELEAFDYLLSETLDYSEKSLNGPLKIIYAGNLSYEKATYLYNKKIEELNNVQLDVYGQYFEQSRVGSSKVNYKGMFNPTTPHLLENYHFGLIWEGTSLESCKGGYGEYIRYNNPHKFSLYLSLGLPVIVWKEAAIASFVEEHNLGLTISHFHELEDIAKQITEECYKGYLSNVSAFSEKVRQGFFLKTAIRKLKT